MASGPIIPEDETLFAESVLADDGGPGGAPDYLSGVNDYTGAGAEMDEEEFGALISGGVEVAENYVDTELSPDRELAARYYRGEPFGNEVDGRSGVVATEVRDAILAVMPGLLRIFTTNKRPVTFSPQPGTPTEQADLQTEYVTHVMMRDNSGFEIIFDAIKDALQKKTGIFGWEWQEREMVTATRFTGLTEEAFALLQLEATDASDADEGLEYTVQVDSEEPDQTQPSGSMVPDILSSLEPGDESLPGAPPVPMIRSGIVRRRIIRKRVKVEAVPPEEFIVTPGSGRDLDTFALVGRRREMRIGDIVALGHDEEEIRALVGAGDGGASVIDNPETQERNGGVVNDRLFDAGFERADPASEYIKYCVLYVLVDFDGDGILERRKVVTVGKANHVIYNEIWDDDSVPFATICPDPEQHSPFGGSVADWTMDLQEIKSEILRGTLDSLSESITSSRAINKNNVNIDDALNPARGALVRVNGSPAENIMDFTRPFVGGQSLPILAYLDEMKTRRTGTNPASPSGIDADAIQSTATEGVAAQVESAHERTEMIGRIFAETGFVRLYRGIRNLTCRHQDFRRVLHIKGKAVLIDPRSWNADLDCVVDPALGHGAAGKRLQGLTFIMSKQQEFIEKFGVDNPVCNMQHISYTMSEMVSELGFNTPDRFFAPYTPEMQQAAVEKQNAIAAQPTPQQLLFKAQTDKTDKEFQAKMAALQERRDSAIRADETKRAAEEMRFAIAAAKLLGDYGAQAEKAALDLRAADTADVHAIADDLNREAPSLEPTPPTPPAGPQAGGNPQGDA
jgi:hypothetical protein